MADNRSKAVAPFLVNNWGRGADIFSFSRDLGPVVKKGDSCDIPSSSNVTINEAETGTPDDLTLTPDTLSVSRTKTAFVNLGNLASLQELDGNLRDAYLLKMLGDLRNALGRDYIEHLIKAIAGASPSNHVNLEGDAVTAGDVNELEARMFEQGGAEHPNMFWMGSPRGLSAIKNVADYEANDQLAAQAFGIPMIRSINGYPSVQSSLIPGGEDAYRLSVTPSATTVSGNVATATVPAGHGFVHGQLIWTSGASVDVSVDSPVAISVNSATEFEYALTTGDGALGAPGVIYSATAMTLLLDSSRLFHAFAGLVPQYHEVKKSGGDAGWELQLVTHFGRQAIAGAVKILHSPD